MAKPYRPIRTNNLLKLLNWARQYQREGTMPQPIGMRFGIGLYQVGQAKGWDNGPAAWQGYAAAALHWFMVSEYFKLPMETDLPIELDKTGSWPDIRTIQGYYPGDTTVLHCVCKAQQMLVYAIHCEASNRKNRYDPQVFSSYLARLITSMIVMIPQEYRATAFHDEMQILVGDIVAKPGEK